MTLPALLTLRDDCLLDATSELSQARERVAELKRENEKLRAEILRLTERRAEFDLSADTPMLCKLQAG